MKFLLDQGLPRSTVIELSALGLLATHVGQLNMSSASDAAILLAARQRGEVIVTFDADFHSLLAMQQERGPSVIRIRIEGLSAVDAAAIIERVMTVAKDDLTRGAAVSVTTNGIRVRLLPLA
jgi:predicted nuclease of predicted toxin-antitoxin system